MKNDFNQLLKNADISGAQLARRLGVTTSAVSAWCRGKCAPKYELLSDIARYLNVSVDRVVKCFI